MKITMYTITGCQFSKHEKEYLTAHSLQFEEKNLETNREFLTEMLAVSNNFAGTPVTKIEKDDGQIVVLKGFTAAEFDTALGKAPAVQVEPVKAAEPVAAAPAPVMEAPVAPLPVEQPVAPAPVAPAPAPAIPDPAMASVLNTLEQQAMPSEAPVAQAPVAPVAPVPPTPVIPDPQF